jgi:Xaa-Pro aminopeptidase
MTDFTIQKEKLAQAVGILQEQNVPCWITFVRETSHNADPALGLIVDINMTWHSAFIVTATGRKVAIVGRYDTENVRRMGGYDEVIGYDQSIEPELMKFLDAFNPSKIAVNYSESDTAADGLSHGMYLTLQRYINGKYPLVSAENILNALRGRKTPGEIARIKKAIGITEEIVEELITVIRPGANEKEIGDYIHDAMAERGVVPSWEAAYCPIVNCGPDSPVGHTGPSADFVAQPGHIVHIDLGVLADGYVSDMQRLWYLQKPNEYEIPAAVQRAFSAVRGAILAGAEKLKPGVQGWEVDAAARKFIVDAGYPEYQHALGHHIGRTVHDGATLLGPRWERYGNSPLGVVEVGNCYTLELGVSVQGHGLVSLEEDVLVTENGVEWLSEPQTDLTVVLS